MFVVQKTEYSSDSINSPEISQDDDSNHQWAQRNRVPHCVDEIKTVKDLLLEKDNVLEDQQGSKNEDLEEYSI